MTTTKRPKMEMPPFPEGYKGAREIPEWVWKLIDEKPNASEAWHKLEGLCEDIEPDEAELYRALQEYRKEKR